MYKKIALANGGITADMLASKIGDNNDDDANNDFRSVRERAAKCIAQLLLKL